MRMIDWDSENWGNGVHFAADGSWVTDKHGDRFGVALIAYTQTVITMPTKPVGATVNIEVDVFAKYVESLLEGRVERDRTRA